MPHEYNSLTKKHLIIWDKLMYGYNQSINSDVYEIKMIFTMSGEWSWETG